MVNLSSRLVGELDTLEQFILTNGMAQGESWVNDMKSKLYLVQKNI